VSSVIGSWPTAGVRVTFDLVASEGAAASYRAEVVTPDARRAAALRIGETIDLTWGEVVEREVGMRPAPLEPGDEAFVRQLARQVHKQATSVSKEQGGGRWPRRVQRWRGPK
jgi:hypothetical protein